MFGSFYNLTTFKKQADVKAEQFFVASQKVKGSKQSHRILKVYRCKKSQLHPNHSLNISYFARVHEEMKWNFRAPITFKEWSIKASESGPKSGKKRKW